MLRCVSQCPTGDAISFWLCQLRIYVIRVLLLMTSECYGINIILFSVRFNCEECIYVGALQTVAGYHTVPFSTLNSSYGIYHQDNNHPIH